MPELFLRCWIALFDRVGADERGQSTAEYALVLLAVAALVGLFLTWTTKTNMIDKLFDSVIKKIIPG